MSTNSDTWYVSFLPVQTSEKRRLRGYPRQTRTFKTEAEAQQFAKIRLSDSTEVRAGTINPHQPKQVIATDEIASWVDREAWVTR